MAHPLETMPSPDQGPHNNNGAQVAEQRVDGDTQTPQVSHPDGQPSVAPTENPDGANTYSSQALPEGQGPPYVTANQSPYPGQVTDNRNIGPHTYIPPQPGQYATPNYQPPATTPEKPKSWLRSKTAAVIAGVAVLAAGAGGGYAAAKGGSDKAAPKAPTGSSAPAAPGNPNHSASPEAPTAQEMDPAVQQLIEKFNLVQRDAGKYAEGTGDFGTKHKDVFPTKYYDLSPLQSAALTDADKQAMARLIVENNWPVAVNTNNLNVIDPSKKPDDAPTPFPFIVNYNPLAQTLLGWPHSEQIRAINKDQLDKGLVVTPGSTDDGTQTFNIVATKPIAYTGAPYTPPLPGLNGELPKSVAEPIITGDQVSATVLRQFQLRYNDETRALVYLNLDGLGTGSFVRS